MFHPPPSRGQRGILIYSMCERGKRASLMVCETSTVCELPGGEVVWVLGSRIHGSWVRVPPLVLADEH